MDNIKIQLNISKSINLPVQSFVYTYHYCLPYRARKMYDYTKK